jgi:polar amino acid transport system substrate-binding protein
LGVEIEFDRTSKNFNSLVKRVGANDFDIAIGKLGLTYNRLFDAFPVQYLSFRHALLANRKFVSSLGVDSDDPEFASVLKNSAMRIGSISNSTWETEAKVNFPNCEFIGFSNWQEAKNALFKIDPKSKKPVIDAIYRDATEIKPIVYKDPDLSLEYVPILFDDIIDRKSIYLSEKGYVGFTDFLNVFIRREWGEVKSDQRILDDYQTFYQPSVN